MVDEKNLDKYIIAKVHCPNCDNVMIYMDTIKMFSCGKCLCYFEIQLVEHLEEDKILN